MDQRSLTGGHLADQSQTHGRSGPDPFVVADGGAAQHVARRARCSLPIGSGAETMPTPACGSKKVAPSEAMTMSDSLTKYIPPPEAMP
ncbi:hypothetical protein [Streptomyces sp. NBC_01518]|uniref:hypothetical protein n=1 Tax=Streptomyces sp. NBC_01518 TaxID=2903891 RepID=UPI003864A29C